MQLANGMTKELSLTLSRQQWALVEEVLARAISQIGNEAQGFIQKTQWTKMQGNDRELCRIRHKVSEKAFGASLGITESLLRHGLTKCAE